MSCDGPNSKKSLCIIPVATSQHSISTVTPFNKRKCVAFGPLASSFMGFHFSAQTLPACHTWVQNYPSSHHWIFNVHEIPDNRFPGFLARIFGHSFDLHSNSIALPLKTLDTFAPRAVLIHGDTYCRQPLGPHSLLSLPLSLLSPLPLKVLDSVSPTAVFVCCRQSFRRHFPHLSTLRFSTRQSVFLRRVVSYLS